MKLPNVCVEVWEQIYRNCDIVTRLRLRHIFPELGNTRKNDFESLAFLIEPTEGGLLWREGRYEHRRIAVGKIWLEKWYEIVTAEDAGNPWIMYGYYSFEGSYTSESKSSDSPSLRCVVSR